MSWLRWFGMRTAEVVMLLAFGAGLMVPLATVYDAVEFHRVRAHVNVELRRLTPSERMPSERVKRAFRYDRLLMQRFYGHVAGAICKSICDRLGHFTPGSFRQYEPALIWPPLLRVHYSRDEMFGVYLHAWHAGETAIAAYGRDLDALTDTELVCVAQFVDAPSRACAEVRGALKRRRSN